LDVVSAWRSLTSFVAGGVRSNWHLGSNPLFTKNGDAPVVSEAWLFAANSASGNQLSEPVPMATDDDRQCGASANGK
jgi:hypothetical protein